MLTAQRSLYLASSLSLVLASGWPRRLCAGRSQAPLASRDTGVKGVNVSEPNTACAETPAAP